MVTKNFPKKLRSYLAKPSAGIGLVTVLLALSTVARATTVLILDPNWGDYTQYSYTDTSGHAQPGDVIGPYSATLNGGGYNNTAVDLFCYDFNSPTYIGAPYNGTMHTVTDFSGATLTAMMEASYLIYDLSVARLYNAPLPIRGAISMAIWEVMNPSSTTSLAQFPTDPAALPYEAAAATMVSNGTWTVADAALYPIWVPDDPSIQRFGIVAVGNIPSPPGFSLATPEPGTLILAGLSLIATARILKRRSARMNGGRDDVNSRR